MNDPFFLTARSDVNFPGPHRHPLSKSGATAARTNLPHRIVIPLPRPLSMQCYKPSKESGIALFDLFRDFCREAFGGSLIDTRETHCYAKVRHPEAQPFDHFR